jgi:DHA2 family multidrug resistance protein
VFFINLPIGILTLAGLYLFLPPAERRPLPDFDFFGFATLSVAIGGLQLMLDRGELLGWFGSTEIVTEAVLAGLGFYLFLVHSATHRHPFISPALFKDRNFLVGNFLIFSIGMVMFANLALLPQLLQTLLGYPVLTAGILIAPRGIGTMAAMLVVGRIMGKIDPRLIMGIGLGLMALSLWQMTGWSLDMNSAPFVTAGLIQGLGIGLVWVPLSAVAFTTLNPHFRSEGTAFFSLLRNVGSSIGISVVQFLLTQNTQINHATLNEHASVERLWGMSRTALAFLNAQVTRQAAMIAFLDDFQLMLILTLGSIPLLLIFRKNGGNKPDGHAAVME